jgi:hypothetical protein
VVPLGGTSDPETYHFRTNAEPDRGSTVTKYRFAKTVKKVRRRSWKNMSKFGLGDVEDIQGAALVWV